MENWIIGAVVVAALVAWAWVSEKAGRFVLGLHEAKCPHCKAVNTLNVVDQPSTLESIIPGVADERRGLLICNKCQETCRLTDVTMPGEGHQPNHPAAA